MHVFKQAYVAIGHDTDVAEGVSKASGKVFGRGLNTMVLFSGALDSLEPFAEYGLPTDGSVDTAELLLDLYLEGFAVCITLTPNPTSIVYHWLDTVFHSALTALISILYHSEIVPLALFTEDI